MGNMARSAGRPLLAVAVAGAPVVVLALASGGGYPTAWNAATVVTAGFLLAYRRDLLLGRWSLMVLALLALMTAISAASYIWSADPPATVGEVERWAAMLALAAGMCVVTRVWSVAALPFGVASAAAVVCAYAILLRALPPSLGGGGGAVINRLYQPVGYWNGLGELAAIGIVLATGIAAHCSDRVRMAAAAGIVPLTAALYLTFSRGAVLSAVVGLGVMLILERRDRFGSFARCVIIAPPALLTLIMLQLLPGLRSAHAARETVVSESRLAAVAMVVIALAGMWMAARRWDEVVARLGESETSRRRTVAAACAASVVLVVGLFVAAGGPSVVSRTVGSAGQSSPHFKGGDLNLRLLSLSPNGRSEIWRVAWHDALDHPLLGSGDGTFAQRWLRFRPETDPAVAAHSLILETAAELGLLGLAVLLALFVVPFAAAHRVPGAPERASMAGAVAGALLQMSFDWTWDVTAVTAAVLACIVGLCAAADKATRSKVRNATRFLVTGAVVVGALAAFALLGNVEMWRAQRALDAGAYVTAAHRAGRAAALAPWSAAPLRIEAYADGRAGHHVPALNAARRGASRAPGEWWFWFQLACLSSGQDRAASLARVISLNPHAGELLHFPRRCGEPLNVSG
jgi:hypothetical protein